MSGLWTSEKPRQGKDGRRWNFAHWYSVWWVADHAKTAQRLFFWDDDKRECGAVLLGPGKVMHYSKIVSLIAKLVADGSLRQKYRRDIKFPLQRHYGDYGSLPEETLDS